MPGPSQSGTWDEKIPAGAYDPGNPTPYTAPKLPEITAPPQRPPEQTQQPQAPKVAGKGSGMATAAFGLDSILRGYMRGREQANQQKAYKAKQLSDGLQYAYETAAQQYVEMVRSGADPNSEQVKRADMAQRAAYQSLMQMRGNYIEGQGGKSKKSKSNGSGKGTGAGAGAGAEEDPMQMLMSPDPQVKMRGAYLLQQKMFSKVGTPANAMATQWLTPEYRKHLELSKGSQRIEGDVQQKRIDLHDLQNKDPKTMSADDQAKLTRLQHDPELFPKMGGAPKKVNTKITPDNHQWTEWEKPDGTTEWRDEGPVRAYASETKPIRAWSVRDGKPVSVEVDPKTNQIIPGTENNQIAPPSGMMEHVHTGEFSWTDAEGNLHRQQTTSTTSPVMPRAGAGAGAGASTGANTGSSGHGSGHAMANTSSSSSSSSPSSSTVSPHDRVIGNTGKGADQSGVRKNVLKAADQARSLSNLLTTQSQYMDSIKSNPGAATPRQDLALVVAAVRAMNPGSVRLPQKELELEMKAGSFGDRFSRWYEVSSTGLLPEDQRNDLFGIVKNETTTMGKNVVRDWKNVLKGQPLPSHLQQFDDGGSGKSASTSASTSAPHAVDAILDDMLNTKK